MIRDRFRRLRLTSWKTLRWALGFAAVPPILWACTTHPLEKPHPKPVSQTDQYVDLNPNRDIDIVFVIDNSPSMAEEQANLRRNFPAFIDELKRIPGGLPNVHIGVVTSDVGAGTLVSRQCQPGGQRGAFQTKPTCGLLDKDATFIQSVNKGTGNNFEGDIEKVFSCIADVGAAGCGYEHQLQAARISLLPPDRGGPPENVGFLRKDAYLAVIFLTDEDDCSAPTNSDLFGASMDTTGVASSLRCSIQGHVCGTAHPTATNGYSQNLSDCRPAQDGKLIGISDFVDFFIGLKDGRREKVVVSAIAGWPTGDASTAKYEYKNVPDGNMVELRESPTCTYGGGGAAAGIRMKTFVESFGENGYFTTICQEDFRAAMGKIGRILAARLQNRCVAGPLADSDPTKQGLQPDCRVVVRTPSGNNAWMERVLQNCDKSAPPCWKLVPTPANGEEVCEHGFKIDVERNGAMPPPDTQDVIKCLTEAGKL